MNIPTENLAALQTSLDSLINAGANVNCKCGVTKNYRNLLQTLGNTMHLIR